MSKIFYVMGKSASGKDTIYKRLLVECSLHALVPYTTRPMRNGEEDGKDYHFTDEAGLKKLRENGKVVEERCYHTVHGDWFYFTVDDTSGEGDYLAIGTPQSYGALRKYYGEEKCIPLYIEVEDGVRLERALARERAQKEPKYKEMCRRFIADTEDFAPEVIKKLGIEKKFQNEELEACIANIKSYIEEVSHG